MDYILEIDNNISPEICKEMIDRFEKDDRKSDGVIIGGGNKMTMFKHKISKDLNISNYTNSDDKNGIFWGDIDEYLCKQLREGIKKYQSHIIDMYATKSMLSDCDFGADLFANMHDLGYQIQRTTKGGYYKWHNDSFDEQRRKITFIWYLNDVNPEHGGSTDFECGKRIVPKQGKLVMFPATWTYPHTGRPVTGDIKKYICTGWLCDK